MFSLLIHPLDSFHVDPKITLYGYSRGKNHTLCIMPSLNDLVGFQSL